MSRTFTRVLSPCLVITFYVLIGLHIYAFFTIVMPLLKDRLGTTLGLIWIVVGLSLMYNVVFNHFLAMIIKPGGPQDTRMIEQMRSQQKNRATRKEVTDERDERFEGLSSNVKQLLRYRTKTMEQLEMFWPNNCDRCEMIKPARAHHCSICQRCVYLMDHHCPWINNCVGLENQRYFLLLSFYLMLGSAYTIITVVSMWHHHSFIKVRSMMNFVMLLQPCLCVVMAGFTGWLWWLACCGITTIEFWTVFSAEEKMAALGFAKSADNLFRVFGTHKLLRLLSPSTRNVPFTGLEWSFWLKDNGYDAHGYELPSRSRQKDQEIGETEQRQEHTGAALDNDDELEMVLIQQT